MSDAVVDVLGVDPETIVRGWRCEIHGVGDPKDHWCWNALVFGSEDEARAYGNELASRWFGMDDYRAGESDNSPTHRACTKVHNPSLDEACTVDRCYYGKVTKLEVSDVPAV